LVLVVSCSDDGGEVDANVRPGEGAETALGAVDQLVDALRSGEFGEASHLAIRGQSALAALAEGAGFAEVADALRNGDEEVAANFWAGFAQGAGSFLTGSISTAEGSSIERDGVTFTTIEVVPDDGVARTVLVRDADGFRIDLLASFGGGLADKMIGPAERLLNTQTEDARLILSELQGNVSSLLVATGLPGTSAEVSQLLTSLVEIITRLG
jgi:hypothetical protein